MDALFAELDERFGYAQAGIEALTTQKEIAEGSRTEPISLRLLIKMQKYANWKGELQTQRPEYHGFKKS